MEKKPISITNATKLPEGFSLAFKRWQALSEQLLQNNEIHWYAKGVFTSFSFDSENYVISCKDIYSEQMFNSYQIGYLMAGFERLQKTITDDLEQLGAKDIVNSGLID